MRVSALALTTLKEAPAEAEVISHQLMLRAGLIKKLGSGIYSWLPLGLRILRKVETVIREEMGRAGALEVLLPAVQPAELWQETGRWECFGPDMLKIEDRHGRPFCFGPTHEEVITDIVRRDIRSYKQLPVNFFQIQVKFRDEIRPRFGVMRAREFIMKDAYSFDTDTEGLKKSYALMYAAYERIFTRLGLIFRAVAADTGAIGGSASHEFQVLAESGEDAIAYCKTSDYAANVELAEALAPSASRPPPAEDLTKVATPGRSTCEQVAELLNFPLSRTVKCLLLWANRDGNERVHMLLIRGDHTLNELKVAKIPGFSGFRWATDTEIISALGCKPGYLGPVGIDADVPLVVDRTVAVMADFVCGANEADYHLKGANFGRDIREPDLIADIRNVVVGDPSPDGKGTLDIQRGIEVGHVFALGTQYSEAMNATFLDKNGQPRFAEMGCYGIGVTRIVAAAIEQNNDAKGILWPEAMAPFLVAIAPIGYRKNESVRAAADAVYEELKASNIEVLLDDRDERAGVMFADLELIGIPHRITIGDRELKKGQVEYQSRRDTASTLVAVGEISAFVKQRILQ